jgi:hypothetical protein
MTEQKNKVNVKVETEETSSQNEIPKDAPVVNKNKEIREESKMPSVADLIPKIPGPAHIQTIQVPKFTERTPIYSEDPLVNAEVIRIKEERARVLREEAERQAQAMARVLLLEEERKQAERQGQIRDQAEIIINSERFDALTESEKNELYMDYYISAGNIQKFLSKYPYMHNLLGKYNISQRSIDYRKRCEEEKQILARIQEEQRQRELQMERERIAMEVRRAEEERIRKERREKYERELNEVNREIQILEENLARAKQRKAQVIADNI